MFFLNLIGINSPLYLQGIGDTFNGIGYLGACILLWWGLYKFAYKKLGYQYPKIWSFVTVFVATFIKLPF